MGVVVFDHGLLYHCLADCLIKGGVKDVVLLTLFPPRPWILTRVRLGECRAGHGARVCVWTHSLIHVTSFALRAHSHPRYLQHVQHVQHVQHDFMSPSQGEGGGFPRSTPTGRKV